MSRIPVRLKDLVEAVEELSSNVDHVQSSCNN